MGVLREIKVPDTRRKKRWIFLHEKRFFFTQKRCAIFTEGGSQEKYRTLTRVVKKIFLLKNYAQILQVGPKIPSLC